MKCDLPKDYLIGFLFEECPEEHRALVSQHLKDCPDCRGELLAIKQTTSTLKAWPDQVPEASFVLRPRTSGGFLQALRDMLATLSPRQRGITLGGMALAALLLLFSVANFRFSYGTAGLQAGFSLLPANSRAAAATADRQQLEALMATWQASTMDSLRQLVAASEKQVRRDHQQSMLQLARAVSQQRSRDLQLLGEGLDVFQTFNEQRIEQTREQVRQTNSLLKQISAVR